MLHNEGVAIFLLYLTIVMADFLSLQAVVDIRFF